MDGFSQLIQATSKDSYGMPPPSVLAVELLDHPSILCTQGYPREPWCGRGGCSPTETRLLHMQLLYMHKKMVQGKKEYTPPPLDPSFLGLSPDPEVTEQKKLWCIPFSWENKERVYTIGPERRVYTIEPQTRKKKKGRSPRWWCILFSSLWCTTRLGNGNWTQTFISQTFGCFRDIPAKVLV